jgi:outer membrane receptor protein involved in Fe transport
VAYTITLSDKYRQFLTDPLIDYRDSIANFNSRSRVRATLSWNLKDWNATVLGTRYGSIGNSVNAAGTNAVGTSYGARLAPFMLYNLTVGKSFGENLRAQVAVINVFNNTDREDASATGYPFFEYYLGADPTGRRFNLSVNYKF